MRIKTALAITSLLSSLTYADTWPAASFWSINGPYGGVQVFPGRNWTASANDWANPWLDRTFNLQTSARWDWLSDLDWREYTATYGTDAPYQSGMPRRLYGLPTDDIPTPANGWVLYCRRLYANEGYPSNYVQYPQMKTSGARYFALYNRYTNILRFYVDVSDFGGNNDGFEKTQVELKLIPASQNNAVRPLPTSTDLFQFGKSPASANSSSGLHVAMIDFPPMGNVWYAFDVPVAYDSRLASDDYEILVSLKGMYSRDFVASGTYSGTSTSLTSSGSGSGSNIFDYTTSTVVGMQKGFGRAGEFGDFLRRAADDLRNRGITEQGERTIQALMEGNPLYEQLTSTNFPIFVKDMRESEFLNGVGSLLQTGSKIASIAGKALPVIGAASAMLDVVGSVGGAPSAPQITYQSGFISLNGAIKSTGYFQNYPVGVSGASPTSNYAALIPSYAKNTGNTGIGEYRIKKAPKLLVIVSPRTMWATQDNPTSCRNATTGLITTPVDQGGGRLGCNGFYPTWPGEAANDNYRSYAIWPTSALWSLTDWSLENCVTRNRVQVCNLPQADYYVAIENPRMWIEENPANKYYVQESFAIAPANGALIVGQPNTQFIESSAYPFSPGLVRYEGTMHLPGLAYQRSPGTHYLYSYSKTVDQIRNYQYSGKVRIKYIRTHIGESVSGVYTSFLNGVVDDRLTTSSITVEAEATFVITPPSLDFMYKTGGYGYHTFASDQSRSCYYDVIRELGNPSSSCAEQPDSIVTRSDAQAIINKFYNPLMATYRTPPGKPRLKPRCGFLMSDEQKCFDFGNPKTSRVATNSIMIR